MSDRNERAEACFQDRRATWPALAVLPDAGHRGCVDYLFNDQHVEVLVGSAKTRLDDGDGLCRLAEFAIPLSPASLVGPEGLEPPTRRL